MDAERAQHLMAYLDRLVTLQASGFHVAREIAATNAQIQGELNITVEHPSK